MNLRAEVLRRLEKMDVNPKRSLGQNFLIDEGVVEKIIRSVETTKSRQIVEIGPGVGSLTDSLINLGVPLILIELDRSFAGYWRERELRVVEGDALRIQWQDLDLISPTLLVSNLPYQISTSLVVDRCFAPIEITEMILMFQKEVAQRLTSSPRTKEYGMLSVIAQLFWQIRGVGEAGPKCFYPPPKVASRVLHFQRREEGSIRLDRQFLQFVKAAFSYRRKIIWKNLTSEYGKFGLSMEEAIDLGSRLGLGRTLRAEELTPEDFKHLYLEFFQFHHCAGLNSENNPHK